MSNYPDWREIAANLVSALELQREAVAVTHVIRPQSLTDDEIRRLGELQEQISDCERDALEALDSTHRDPHWRFQLVN
jgi:hypothetical protein